MTGLVVDDETGKAVSGAMVACLNSVYSDETAPGVLTDENDSYEIEGLMTGWHAVTATAEGSYVEKHDDEQQQVPQNTNSGTPKPEDGQSDQKSERHLREEPQQQPGPV